MGRLLYRALTTHRAGH